MITTTLNRIRKHSPSPYDWTKLLNGLGKTEPDNEPLPFATILEINGLDDVLWCCRVEPQYAKEWRLFAVTCARRVERLNTDPRLKNVIDVAERYANGEATDEELRVTWDAAKNTAGDVAWDAAWGVAGDIARDAVLSAARNATWATAEYTAGVAWSDAWTAAEAAEREWQTQEFLRVVTEIEAREEVSDG
jgi:hypothetical protein